MSDEQIEDFKAQAAAATPLGRTGLPKEVAAAVLFLASGKSSYLNVSKSSSTVDPCKSEGFEPTIDFTETREDS